MNVVLDPDRRRDFVGGVEARRRAVSTLGKPDESKAHEHEARAVGYLTEPAAHEQLEKKHTRGKIVLEVAG